MITWLHFKTRHIQVISKVRKLNKMFFEKENQMYLITSVVVVTVKFNYHHDQRHRVIKHFLYSCFSCVKVWECCFHIPHHFWLNDLNLHIEKKQNWWYGKQQNFSTHKYYSRHLLFHTRPHTGMNVTTPKHTFMKNFFEETEMNSPYRKFQISVPSKVVFVCFVTWCNDD